MEETVSQKCEWCGSDDVIFMRDEHTHVTQDGAEYGIIKCQSCNQIAFWYHKVKFSTKIVNGKLTCNHHTVFKLVDCWDGPITQFMFNILAEASESTGRPLASYYTTYLLSGNMKDGGGEVKQRYLDFSEVKKAFLDTREHILGT